VLRVVSRIITLNCEQLMFDGTLEREIDRFASLTCTNPCSLDVLVISVELYSPAKKIKNDFHTLVGENTHLRRSRIYGSLK